MDYQLIFDIFIKRHNKYKDTFFFNRLNKQFLIFPIEKLISY